MTTAEQTEPFVSLSINVIFLHEIPTGIIGPSARLSVSSVFSVDYKKFVCIRVNSWFLKNDLVAA